MYSVEEYAEQARVELGAAVDAARHGDENGVKIGLAAAQAFSNLAIAAAIIETNEEAQ